MPTSLAAQELGIPMWKLLKLVYERKISEPARFGRGPYSWSQANLEEARKALSGSAQRPNQ